MNQSKKYDAVASRRAGRTLRRMLMLIGALALFVAACGSDSDSDSTSDTQAPPASEDTATTSAAPAPDEDAATTSEAAPAPDEESVTVRWAAPGHVPLYMTQDYGFAHGLFEDNGVEIDLQPTIFNAAEVLQIVLSGDADVAFTSPVTAFAAVEQGRDAVIVALVTGSPIDVALTNSAMDRLAETGITAESPLADKLAALEGLTLGHPGVGSGTETIFLLALDKYDIGVDGMTLQPISDPTAMVAAARAEAVDGIIHTTGGVPTQMVGLGIGQQFISIGAEDDTIGAIPSLGLVTTREYLAENPDAVQRVVQTFHDSRAAIRSATRDDLALVKAEYYPDFDEELYYLALDQLTPVIAEGSMAMTDVSFAGLLSAHSAAIGSQSDLTIDELWDGSAVEAVEGQ